MARIARFFTSPLALIARAELCIITAFVLSVIALCAGRWPGPLEGFAILTVDTSSLAKGPDALSINDWYEAHYLSVCTGKFNNHLASMGKNHSTAVCWLQSTGYTFSIANLAPDENGQSSLLEAHHALSTKAPVVLLILSLVSMALAILAFVYTIIILARARNKNQMVKHDLPLIIVSRVAFMSCIASTVLSTISSAKITADAGKSAGSFGVDANKIIHAWTHDGFLTIVWISTGLVWLALGLIVIAAFKISSLLKKEDSTAIEPDRRWYRM